MLRRLVPATAVGTALLASTLVAAPAEAANPAVMFTKVHFDSPGSDRGGNTSLNGEYVVLKNTTRKAIQMERWVLRDETGYRFRFPRFTLKPGKSVTVRSGQGQDSSTTLYWQRKWYVWNNDGDAAGIYRASDLKKIDTCSWGSAGDWKNCA
ncbi:lamin tail domain-containing protein [Nonomuraea sp. NPDC049709]|uniref:lamin tail domain-containing protein n=1 Tax=Nonomuraea sp. NPDC049709 TaxID=3154736 RepID=UPI003432D523